MGKKTYKDGPYNELIQGRGLCTSCYRYVEYHGTLIDWPRLTRSRDELLEDYVVLRQRGYDWKQCAAVIGMKYPSFERAMMRARAAGDIRAQRPNERPTK